MLPGENMNEAKRIMADRLFHELDLDHDGHVTKTEVNTSHTQQRRGNKSPTNRYVRHANT